MDGTRAKEVNQGSERINVGTVFSNTRERHHWSEESRKAKSEAMKGRVHHILRFMPGQFDRFSCVHS
jgi:hypothetical protein